MTREREMMTGNDVATRRAMVLTVDLDESSDSTTTSCVDKLRLQLRLANVLGCLIILAIIGNWGVKSRSNSHKRQSFLVFIPWRHSMSDKRFPTIRSMGFRPLDVSAREKKPSIGVNLFYLAVPRKAVKSHSSSPNLTQAKFLHSTPNSNRNHDS
ncbi:hypothetical protein F4825DRAFT_318812 [Nemania diffusa]|nr:hypothetical protein F4825DRAFT_318812 [Nemania diffusa]